GPEAVQRPALDLLRVQRIKFFTRAEQQELFCKKIIALMHHTPIPRTGV
ncbi:MAG: hypothetical protein RL742_522, partial [Bacteroidota bacterium]